MSEDGSRFQYTSVHLFIQCLINFGIAVICSSPCLPSRVGQKVIGKDEKKFNLNLPKKDLVGRAAIYYIKDKR